MIFKILKRFREPSSYAGLGLIAFGLGDLFKIAEADQIGLLAEKTANAMTVDTATGFGVLLMGIMSIFLKEKADNGK